MVADLYGTHAFKRSPKRNKAAVREGAQTRKQTHGQALGPMALADVKGATKGYLATI